MLYALHYKVGMSNRNARGAETDFFNHGSRLGGTDEGEKLDANYANFR
jgi:hypothetical protein